LDSVVQTDVSGLDVVGFSLVKGAVVQVSNQDSNINPWDGGPVGVIISLFGTFVSVSVGVVVLSSVSGSVSSQVSIVDPQSLVSLSSSASLVVGVGFVHSVGQLSVGNIDGSVGVVSDGVSGDSVSEKSNGLGIRVAAHVLENNVANQLLIDSTTVLGSPLDGQERTFIEGHGGSIAESSLSVVLRIEQSVGIVSISVGFVESIIASSRVLQVHIGIGQSQEKRKGYDELHQ